jgi:uncharacterized MnhB-related membrane protein
MELLQGTLLVLTAAGGTAVALTRRPKRQALALSLFGLVLTLLFLVYQAPDVALSELAVGAAALPLMLLVALARVQGRGDSPTGDEAQKPEGGDE